MTRDSLPWLALAGGAVACSIAMAWVHRLALRRRNGGLVDVAWSIGVGVMALLQMAAGSGNGARRLFFGALVAIWSARLASHLLRRTRSEPEDGRYQALREQWGDRAEARFFWFCQAQAWMTALLTLSALPIAAAAAPFPRALDLAAIALLAVSLAGEAIADAQLRRFRADRANRGRTCRAGLWRFSRHPNFFFESLQWWAWPLLAWGAPHAWLAWIAPPLMLASILFLTGIPPTEAQALRTRGDDYRDYQRTTSAFVPWPPRRTARSGA